MGSVLIFGSSTKLLCAGKNWFDDRSHKLGLWRLKRLDSIYAQSFFSFAEFRKGSASRMFQASPCPKKKPVSLGYHCTVIYYYHLKPLSVSNISPSPLHTVSQYVRNSFLSGILLYYFTTGHLELYFLKHINFGSLK